jgi:beta-galactosidase
MRGLKDGESFMMQEQSPNQQNWQPYSKLKRPGEVRMLSYQAMAHGSDTCLYFQLRQSIAGQEMFHGALISHAGHEHTRTFRECAQIGKELSQIGDAFLGGRTPSDIGILFDWDNWWILEYAAVYFTPSKNFNYLKKISKYYKALFDANISVDMVSMETDFSRYKVLYAPYLYMMKGDIAKRLEAFVEKGGTLITTTLSGLVDENNRAIFGEYPGPLRELLGIWVEETDALKPEEKNQICLTEKLLPEEQYACSFQCDIIHLRGARALGKYESDFYAGTPVFTVNDFGKGKAYYIGTEPDAAFLTDFGQYICRENQITPPYPVSGNVEITRRINEKNEVVFVLNHSQEETASVELGEDVFTDLIHGQEATGSTMVQPYDVLVLRRDRQDIENA